MALLTKNSKLVGSPSEGQRLVVTPRYEPTMSRPEAGGESLTRARACETQLIRFQPLITLMGPGHATPAHLAAWEQAIQPFAGWIDGIGITEVQFKVEIFRLANADLILESSPFVEEDPAQWVGIANWASPPASPLQSIVNTVSTSVEPAYGSPFSRYIRWRVTAVDANDWEICFRIKALIGSSFAQYREQPRVV